MYNSSKDSKPTLINCTFTHNRAEQGGGMANYYPSYPRVLNCIFWDNEAMTSGAEIVSGNPQVTYTCIAGGRSGEGNIDTDPLFVGAPYSLQFFTESPCIDAGSNDGAPTIDILGRARPIGESIDMGAYEGAVAPEDVVTLTLNISPAGGGETIPLVGIHNYVRGESAFLFARSTDLAFSHWEGGVSGGTFFKKIVMDEDKTITAVFVEGN